MGVLKAQAFQGLAETYAMAVAADPSLGVNPEFRSAIINMSKSVKELQGGLMPGPYRTTLKETFMHKGELYRVDLENIKGHNLRE